MKNLQILFLLIGGLCLAACGSKSAKKASKNAATEKEKIEEVTETEVSNASVETTTETYDYDYESQDVDEYDDTYTEEDYSVDYDVDDYSEEASLSVVDEEEAGLFMNRFKVTYEKLLAFKDDADFHQNGFIQSGDYHHWMLEAQNLRDNPISQQLINRGLITNELVLLGVQYLESKGQETSKTMMFNEDFQKVLY